MALLAGISCKHSPKAQEAQINHVSVPVFNADSAYQYTANQVAFGPRVPNTLAHIACGNYLSGELKRFGAEVIEQETTLKLRDNTPIQIKNIIGSFHLENKNRILLFAHWDSRPFADNEPDINDKYKAIDGANDGAGACAALLEIARQIGTTRPEMGIDIIFFDLEDWGEPRFPVKDKHYGDWCMGSKYWAQNPHIPGYKAKYGILFDMVSAPGAKFYKEFESIRQAGHVVQKVWDAARATGYESYFINQRGGHITDDHSMVNDYRKIPSIDIIHQDFSNEDSGGFASYWHTLSDNMQNVSKETLQAVGQTVLYVLYNEK
ncbi:glutamine cyclotransferase [Bacteroidia bacterium]|nr:glutamine cyclotransferase [Bacteroidia bacterium]